MLRIAMASSSVTIGRLTIASIVMMPACGWLMIGPDAIEPSAPGVVDRERAAGEVVHRQPALPRLEHDLADRERQPGDAFLVGVADDRDHQAVRDGHGDPDVDPLLQDALV